MISLAFDKTARSYDEDGRLHVAKTHISKANICPYYGEEIPGWQSLGLDAKKIYQLFRDPEELKKAAPTFERLPILSRHVPVTVDSPQPDLVVGAIGSDVEFNAPYLDADLSFWDKDAIAGIETEQVEELSAAYRYEPVMEPGEFEGKKYDGRMTNIRGNHLAVVTVGRAGADVVVADANPFLIKDFTMKINKLGKEELKGKLLAQDATLTAQQLDNVIDALIGVEDEPRPVELPTQTAEDETPADKVRALLSGKCDEETINSILSLISAPATDADEKKEDDGEKIKTAMDSLRADMKAAELARRDVSGIVGDVFGMDSAADIYKFALDHMKVDHKGVDSVTALRSMVSLAADRNKPVAFVAQDAAQIPDSVKSMMAKASRFSKS